MPSSVQRFVHPLKRVSQTKPVGSGKNDKAFPFAKWVAALTFLAGLVAGFLHYMGQAIHLHRLATLRVDSGLFPKTSEALLINGFFQTAHRSVDLMKLMLNPKVYQPALFFLASATALGLLLGLVDWCGEKIGPRSVRWVKRQSWPRWVTLPLRRAGTTLLFLFLFPYAVWFVSFLMATVAGIGEIAGIATAEDQLSKWTRGCNHASTMEGCLTILKEDRELSHGFLIDSSESHIALFDVNLCHPVTLEREGTKVFGDLPVLGELSGAAVPQHEAQTPAPGVSAAAASAPSSMASAPMPAQAAARGAQPVDSLTCAQRWRQFAK